MRRHRIVRQRTRGLRLRDRIRFAHHGACSPASPAAAASASPLVEDYLPGLPAQLRLAPVDGPAPLIVMVPGGGWSSADPAGLEPLASRLTADGSTTALITYATTGTGSTFLEAVDDVACAVRWAAQRAAALGRTPSRVIVMGHSAGGHLASLVAFSGQEFGGTCPYPTVGIDGLIGLAGIYDTDQIRPFLSDWMGVDPNQDPDTWRRVNLRRVGARRRTHPGRNEGPARSTATPTPPCRSRRRRTSPTP